MTDHAAEFAEPFRARGYDISRIFCCCPIIAAMALAMPFSTSAKNRRGIWVSRRRGYAPVEGLVGQFAWKDVGDAGESRHDMQFWVKGLQGGAT